jgi:hypothetical protein
VSASEDTLDPAAAAALFAEDVRRGARRSDLRTSRLRERLAARRRRAVERRDPPAWDGRLPPSCVGILGLGPLDAAPAVPADGGAPAEKRARRVLAVEPPPALTARAARVGEEEGEGEGEGTGEALYCFSGISTGR